MHQAHVGFAPCSLRSMKYAVEEQTKQLANTEMEFVYFLFHCLSEFVCIHAIVKQRL